jgi:hypothetical protein
VDSPKQMCVQTKKESNKLLQHVIETRKTRLYIFLTNKTLYFSLFFDDLRFVMKCGKLLNFL